jgi:hypothetical protein
MDVPSVQVPNFGYNPVPVSQVAQQYATIGNLNAETAQRQQETQQGQMQTQATKRQMQRSAYARQVVAGAVDQQSGQLDPMKAVNGLYQAGLSDEAQALQDHLSKQSLQSAQAGMYQQHGGYFAQGGAQGIAGNQKVQQLTIQNHAALLKNIAEEAKTAFNDPNSPDASAFHDSMKPILKGLGAPDEVVNMPYDPVKTPMLYKAMGDGSQAKMDSIKQQQQNTSALAEQDRALQAAAALAEKTRNDKVLESVRSQKLRSSLSATLGGGKLTDLEKEEIAQAKTELQGRGAFGIATKKIDAAIDTRAALNRYYDPATGQYNVPASAYGELTTSLSNLLSVSGGGAGSEAQREDLKQKTAAGDLNGVLSYFSGIPRNATTQAALGILANQVDAVGLQAEQNRNGYGNNIAQKFSGLGVDPGRARILANSVGNSYADFLRQSHNQLGFNLDDRTMQGLYNQGAAPGQQRPQGGGQQRPQASPALKTLSPADASKLAPGTKFKGSDGKIYVR